MTYKEELNQVLQLHLNRLTEEKRLHGARHCVALCHTIVERGETVTWNGRKVLRGELFETIFMP